MAIVYRTDGAWGAGQGTNLSPAQVDGNFYDVTTRVSYIEDNPVEPITPIAINISGGEFTMGLSDGSTLGPITITYPMPLWRGAWAPSVEYNEMDFFTSPDGGLGAVMIAHTSAADFSWAALDPGSGNPVYQQLVGASGTTSGIFDLIDVAPIGPALDGDLLVYNFATSLWVNQTSTTVARTILPAFAGDSGSGGSRGVVPAPAAGDAAAGKVLGAGGGWIVPSVGGGGSTSLAGLSDVEIAGPSNNSLLQYRATDGKWHNVALSIVGGSVTSVDSGVGLSGGPITTSGTLSLAQIASGSVLGNTSGSIAAPISTTLTTLLDAVLGTARGSMLRRDVTAWSVLAPGTAGTYLKSGGAGADVSWDSPAGSGTVTSIATTGGISGGPITATGTLSLAQIASGRVLGNVSGSAAVPTETSLTLLLDNAVGSGRGQILYRGISAWQALSPGTSGYYLQTRGAGADPIWGNVKGGGGAAIAPSLWNEACDLATAEPLPACTYANGSAGVGATLTATSNAALAVDGLMVVLGDRVLVKDQASLQHNGAYVVTATGSGAAPFVLTRAADYDQASTEIIQGSAFPITAGATLENTAWVLITGGTITVGTTPLEFEALTATMPICAPGQVLGNPLSIDAPAIPMDPVGGGAAPKYVVGCYVPGLLTASQNLLYHRFTKAITIPANLGAYSGHTTVAGGGVAATGSTAIALQKATAAAPTSFSTVATITFAAASATGTMSTQAAISFAQGDVLRVQAPASADATFADFHMSLVGQE